MPCSTTSRLKTPTRKRNWPIMSASRRRKAEQAAAAERRAAEIKAEEEAQERFEARGERRPAAPNTGYRVEPRL